MNVNFFVTCIGDALKSRMARDSVLLLEKLGCRVNFPEKQGCCGQPAINSGYIKEAIPGMKNLIAALEDNDDSHYFTGWFLHLCRKKLPDISGG